MSQRQHHDAMNAERAIRAEGTQQQAAVQSAITRESERVKNPDFTETFTETDLDTAVFDWIQAELGPSTAKVHALAYRSGEHPFERQLLNRNYIERLIIQRTPSRQLRQYPLLNYIAQGKPGELARNQAPTQIEGFRAPLSDRKREVLRQASEAITAHQSRSAEGRGIDAVSKVQTESKTIQEDQTKGVAGSVSEKLFGRG